MGIPDRIYRIAKAHLDQALDRWEQIDSNAQKELDDAVQSPALSAFERAHAKINSAQASRGVQPAQQEFTPLPPPAPPGTVPLAERLPVQPPRSSPMETSATRTSARPSNTMVDAAYQIIGVPAGSSFETVRQAYQKLKERASPDRFPAGSPDQAKARDIERRINAAYMTLMDALAPSEDRFDRLEF